MRVVLVVILVLSVAVRARNYDTKPEEPADYDDAWEVEDMAVYNKNLQMHDYVHDNPIPTEEPKEGESRMLKDLKKRYANREERYDDSWMSVPLKRDEKDASFYEDPGLDKLDISARENNGNAWRDDGRCGPSYPNAAGGRGECNPEDPNGHTCCSPGGWCGNTADHCDCASCIEYSDQLELVSATQSSTYGSNGAERAIDGNRNTKAHTTCSTGEKWLKITLKKVACIDQVKITNSHSGNNALRMYGTKIMVADSTQDKELLCGTLMPTSTATIETYNIICNETGVLCGDQIILRQSDGDGRYPGIIGYHCIHVSEIEIYGTRYQDWTAAGERGVYIKLNYNIETDPLQIMTDSVVGSDDLLWVYFNTEDGGSAGGIEVKFTDPPTYWIDSCDSDWISFTIPEDQVRTWTIRKINNSVSLWCNGAEIIVNYQFSNSTRDTCIEHWGNEATKMKFMSNNNGIDTASDEYRAKPTVCTGLPESWTGVLTETEFPVSHGTTLAVSCQEYYKNTGSDEITCDTYLYNDFSYTLEPQCVLGTIEDAAKSTKYYFGKTLEPGDYLEVYGTYMKGTSSFSINIRDARDYFLLHVIFGPTYSTCLMNNYIWGWKSAVACKFPGFRVNEEFKVTIVFMDDHYKIFVNDDLLSTFPYRMEISTATYLWLAGGGNNGFTWNSIKMPGDEKSEVYTLKDVLGEEVQSLADTITAEVQGKSLNEVKRYANSTEGSLAILKWQLLRIINDRGDLMDTSNDTISWILNDRETLETFMTSGDVEYNKYKKALEILAEIIRQDPGAKDDPLKRRLAVATGLTFAKDVRSMANGNFIDGIAKYHTYVNWAAEDVLLAPFYEVSAWHLRYVIGSWQETEELIWARANVVEGYDTADKIADVTHKMVEYKLYNDDGVSVYNGAAYYDNKPYTLKNIHEIGGVCGAISQFGVGMAQAFGVPALAVAQPRHCAYIWYKNDSWKIGNDNGGWSRSSTHTGIQYTWMRSSAYFPLMNDAQENLEGYRLSEKMRISSKMADAADVFEILEDASTVCPQNFAVWEDMEEALNEPTFEPKSAQNALQPTLSSFRESMKEISNIAPEKIITSTCSNETTSKIIDDGNNSEWYCKEETATFEIDFGTPCTIDEIQIRWWGWSKPKNFIISALSSESGEYSIVKTQDDERVEGSFNHWSYLTGWDMKTQKIKVQLNDGKLDYWGWKILFGIRQFRVLGLEHDVIGVISTGKEVTANPESSAADALLDDDNSTVWDSSSNSSWFEINLRGICALNDVEFEWENGASPENLQVSYKVGSGVETEISEDSAVQQVGLEMDLASTIRVELKGGDHSLAGVKVCGVAYSIKDILKIKVSSTLGKYYNVETDILDAIDEFEYDN